MINVGNSKVKVALVGCGRISKKHASLLGTGRIAGAELAAVCDIVPVRARETGDQWRVPWYTKMNVMAYAAEPDLIAILTPSGLHAEHVRRLAPYGIPLLVEKPLALRLDDVDAITKMCEYHGTLLGEVKQNRYNAAVQHLKRALDAGDLGTPHMASVRVWWCRDEAYYQDWHGTWESAGGVLANQAIHHVDLLQWLLGPVRRVSAAASYSPYTDVETGFAATLEFESGCIGTIEATTQARPRDLEGSLSILGDRGSVELGGFAVNEVRQWDIAGVMGDVKALAETPPDVYGFGHKALYEDVVKRVATGDGFPVDGAEARKALEIVHACYQSMETGQPIDVGWECPVSRLGR